MTRDCDNERANIKNMHVRRSHFPILLLTWLTGQTGPSIAIFTRLSPSLCLSVSLCKLQYNSFSIPLAADGQRAKTRTIPPAFDTQITSITSGKNFTFNLCFHLGCSRVSPTWSPSPLPSSLSCFLTFSMMQLQINNKLCIADMNYFS